MNYDASFRRTGENTVKKKSGGAWVPSNSQTPYLYKDKGYGPIPAK